jgi:hypothetical protein
MFNESRGKKRRCVGRRERTRLEFTGPNIANDAAFSCESKMSKKLDLDGFCELDVFFFRHDSHVLQDHYQTVLSCQPAGLRIRKLI